LGYPGHAKKSFPYFDLFFISSLPHLGQNSFFLFKWRQIDETNKAKVIIKNKIDQTFEMFIKIRKEVITKLTTPTNARSKDIPSFSWALTARFTRLPASSKIFFSSLLLDL